MPAPLHEVMPSPLPMMNSQPCVAFRMQFETKTIGPRWLPEFAYVSTRLGFNSILYTAIVRDTALAPAIEQVRSHWPDAVVTYAEQGVTAFRDEDNHLASVQFGALIARKPRRWWNISLF